MRINLQDFFGCRVYRIVDCEWLERQGISPRDRSTYPASAASLLAILRHSWTQTETNAEAAQQVRKVEEERRQPILRNDIKACAWRIVTGEPNFTDNRTAKLRNWAESHFRDTPGGSETIEATEHVAMETPNDFLEVLPRLNEYRSL